MRVLLDNCVDQRLARLLPEHEVVHVRSLGWKDFPDGDILKRADEEFRVLVTVDKGMARQNAAPKQLSVIVLYMHPTTIESYRDNIELIREAIEMAPPGTFTIVLIR